MERTPLFSPRTLAALIALGLLAFGGAAYFLIYGDPATEQTIGANAFSYSSIGHRAFVETLRRQGIPVRISRNNSSGKAGESEVLIIAEPNASWAADNPRRYIESAKNVLIVLPKFQAQRDAANRHWARKLNPYNIETVQNVLRPFAPGGKLVRLSSVAWPANRYGARPRITSPQLIAGAALTPMIEIGGGTVLLGKLERHSRNIWVLSDPDIITNHGLGKGENAALAVKMIRGMLPPGGSVIIDETVHGFYHSPSLWRHVFSLPFAAATILLAVAIALLMWAAAGRFGAPLPAPEPPPAGKTGLIETTARLIGASAHTPYVLKRYQEAVYRDIARALHAPNKFGEPAFDAWLKRLARARGTQADPEELSHAVNVVHRAKQGDTIRATRLARQLFMLKQEMTDEPGGHSNAS
jgi:hypothetical protein